ncbi:hypothetical protein ACCO45_009880 [Purpureocillium lilacinum]|uniref:Uncharacterized protein n=1 Tax=Purpureocillium lilacinum TaxID=33203 RepID=A0ACC4DHI0_PURLI
MWLVAKGTSAGSRADTGASSQRNREFRQRLRVSGGDMSDWAILDGEDDEPSGSQDTDTLDIADGDVWILMDVDNEFDGMYIYDEVAGWVPDSSSADFARKITQTQSMLIIYRSIRFGSNEATPRSD